MAYKKVSNKFNVNYHTITTTIPAAVASVIASPIHKSAKFRQCGLNMQATCLCHLQSK